MGAAQGRVRSTPSLGIGRLAVLALVSCTPATAGRAGDGATTPPSTAAAPPSIGEVSLVFDGVTVVDVEQGKLLPDQRVAIAGNRIQAVGKARAVKIPKAAQIVDARGKYLIPGLWDLHAHVMHSADLFYPLLLANGVTGIRDPATPVPLDTLLLWRREVLAGIRVGPPRQILVGKTINEPSKSEGGTCARDRHPSVMGHHGCVADAAAARRLVDSLKAAGAEMIKPYLLSKEMYAVVAAEARRLGVPFGGHADGVGVTGAADLGASIVDHIGGTASYIGGGGIDTLCFGPQASVERCRMVAERFRRHQTWFMPTLMLYAQDLRYRSMNPHWMKQMPAAQPVFLRFKKFANGFWADSADSLRVWADSLRHGNWLHGPRAPADSRGFLHIARRVGLPILAGTDSGAWKIMDKPLGFSLHGELAMYVAEGLTPLEALQAATLNPAKMLRATDSLGTIAAGKLADLVLLDADPLAEITNTTTIRAVVANGRYFDRAALDRLLAEAQAMDWPGRAMYKRGAKEVIKEVIRHLRGE